MPQNIPIHFSFKQCSSIFQKNTFLSASNLRRKSMSAVWVQVWPRFRHQSLTSAGDHSLKSEGLYTESYLTIPCSGCEVCNPKASNTPHFEPNAGPILENILIFSELCFRWQTLCLSGFGAIMIGIPTGGVCAAFFFMIKYMDFFRDPF